MLSLLGVVAAAGCGPAPLDCAQLERDTDGGMLTCAPLSPPTYDNVYDDVFDHYCDKNSCHSGTHPRGGMNLEDPDTAFDALLVPGEHRVIPGDPECSEVVERISTTDSDWHMPPGDEAQVPPETLCELALWIDMGAQR
jgi:hypothetical protein